MLNTCSTPKKNIENENFFLLTNKVSMKKKCKYTKKEAAVEEVRMEWNEMKDKKCKKVKRFCEYKKIA
jgi:hypothetical protein